MTKTTLIEKRTHGWAADGKCSDHKDKMCKASVKDNTSYLIVQIDPNGETVVGVRRTYGDAMEKMIHLNKPSERWVTGVFYVVEEWNNQ